MYLRLHTRVTYHERNYDVFLIFFISYFYLFHRLRHYTPQISRPVVKKEKVYLKEILGRRG